MLKRRDLLRLFPPGFAYKRELTAAGVCLTLCFCFSLGFFASFQSAKAQLYDVLLDRTLVLIPGAVMPDFCDIVLGHMKLFPAAWAASIFLACVNYAYHFQGSKSIYLMRRLPRKSELYRRCLAFPLIFATAALLLAALLMMLYLLYYMAATPAKCLAPNQFSKLLAALTGGKL